MAIKKYVPWILWLAVTAGLVLYLLPPLLDEKEDKSMYLIGDMTDGHHQIAAACTACHTSPFGGGEVLQQACIDCHGDERVKPFDSHPRAKFTDPRNADRLVNINALECTTCHKEHRLEITQKDGLTQPRDFCSHCHQNIAEDRPSHKGMEFTTCKNSGCHNFHNNRALYTDFLVKHLDDPKVLAKPRLPAREFGKLLEEISDYPRDKYPVKPLNLVDADMPTTATPDPRIHTDWLGSAHAQAGVNCTACHVVAAKEGAKAAWTDHPDHQGCSQCHALEVKRFTQGKHGMRLAVGLTPMTPAQARLPMKDDSGHKALGCTSCHGAHGFDTRQAAVDGCLGCHDDKHSLAYKDSPHYALWQSELKGEHPAGSGVTCASCHMPRISFDVNEWTSRIMVDHNQSADLSPNSKMIRPACLHCHGLGFSIDALADEALINNNFNGQPSSHVDSMRLADEDRRRALRETGDTQE